MSNLSSVLRDVKIDDNDIEIFTDNEDDSDSENEDYDTPLTDIDSEDEKYLEKDLTEEEKKKIFKMGDPLENLEKEHLKDNGGKDPTPGQRRMYETVYNIAFRERAHAIISYRKRQAKASKANTASKAKGAASAAV